MTRRGFTIVELIITITIMGILLTLAVVNVGSTQMKARDDERKTDVEAIATHMESYYINVKSTSVARYPSVGITQESVLKVTLPDIDLKNFTAPGTTDPYATFTAATNSDQTLTGVTPQPTINQYVYQSIQADGSLCTTGIQECRKFNIFYRLESDNQVRVLTSKNQ